MRISFVSTTLALSIALLAPSALATGKEEASPTGKGITGGALLGAEAVMLVEAALDVKPAWAYIVGGLAGGVAGGVGGWAVEDGGDARVSMFLLAGGMALVIPTTVAVPPWPRRSAAGSSASGSGRATRSRPAHSSRTWRPSRRGPGSSKPSTCCTRRAFLQGYLPVMMLAQRARYGLFPAQGDVIPTGPHFVTKATAAQAIRLSKRSIR
jgi:hypothetical protein